MHDITFGRRRRSLLATALLALGVTSVSCRPPCGSTAQRTPELRTDASPVAEQRGEPRFRHFDVKVAIDTDAHAIVGETTIAFDFDVVGPREIAFAANDLTLDGITLDGNAVLHRVEAKNLIVTLSPRGRTSPERLTFRYHGAPSRGLVFGDRFVYSDYFTCAWMICRDEPGDKASVRLDIEVPTGFQVVASGHPVGREAAPRDKVRWSWSEDRPFSPYLFGFAAGEFADASLTAGLTKLRLLGVSETPDTLVRKLTDTPRILAFFAEKAGVPFPHDVYTQVVVTGSEAQEKSSFALLGQENLDPILENPQEDWVVVHELAHQWWGNLVTCASWPHFWLNEGMTSFMVAAYKEDRWGRPAYDREIALFRERRQRAVDAGFDVPLAYAKPYPSLRIKRAITYAKGALFLHALREQIGDAAFWSGIKRYTQEHAGKTVHSRDLRIAMEGASGRDLVPIFRTWVEE